MPHPRGCGVFFWLARAGRLAFDTRRARDCVMGFGKMEFQQFLLAAGLGLLIAAPAWGNDGFGGLTATGLTFGQTEAIEMAEEDLFISLDRVSVDYLFRNRTAQDVTGEVIFPLPPVPMSGLMVSDWNLPDDVTQDNLVGFTATVNGQPVAVSVDRIAVIEPQTRPDSPAALYDTPGRDVTALLAAQGIAPTLDIGALQAQLLALPDAAKAALVAEGLVEFTAADPAYNMPAEAWPAWSVVLRYHWTQTFPAHAELRVSHSYRNLPPGGLFGWTDPPAPDSYEAELQKRYCIDAGTSRGIAKRLHHVMDGESYIMGQHWAISYVLRTANSWAGPIGKFRLTLDKGREDRLISLCADGVKKTGPTTFVIEKTGYTPDRDLEILLVEPITP